MYIPANNVKYEVLHLGIPTPLYDTDHTLQTTTDLLSINPVYRLLSKLSLSLMCVNEC